MRFGRQFRWLRWLIGPAIVWAMYVLRANVWFRLYPAVMVLGVLIIFAFSLFSTPIVETFARRINDRQLDDKGIAYCRRVTQVWTAFLVVHLIVTVFTVFASYEVWAFYNGFLAYVLMGGLFLGEWLVRKKVMNHG